MIAMNDQICDFCQAILSRKWERACDLLDLHKFLLGECIEGKGLLFEAIRLSGGGEVARKFRLLGGDLNRVNEDRVTLVEAVIDARHDAFQEIDSNLQLLLESGASPNALTSYGVRPLQLAIERNSAAMVKILCINGADPLLSDGDMIPSNAIKDAKSNGNEASKVLLEIVRHGDRLI